MATITQLEYVLAVAKAKHFGKAAEECHVAQPSLSNQIQKFEDEIGVVIFDRSKKPILITDMGLEIIEQAQIVIQEFKRLQVIADNGKSYPRGDFNLAVIPTLAPYVIPYFIGEFSKKYPDVNLKINEYKTEDIVKKLINDEIDGALLVTPLNDDRLIERHLFYEPFYAYVSENLPLAKKKVLKESDLDVNNLWLLEEGHCFRSQVLKVCSLNKKSSALSNVEFASGNLETLKNLVKKNSGYTLLPELAIMDLSKEDRKKYIHKINDPIPTREVSLVHGRVFYKENIMNALEDCIVKGIPKNIRSLKKDSYSVIDID